MSLELMEKAEAAVLTTIGPEGFPHTRAMFNLRRREQFPGLSVIFQKHRGDFLVYFTTNTSSSKIAHIRKNPRVSVYYCKPDEWRGLMLINWMALRSVSHTLLDRWEKHEETDGRGFSHRQNTPSGGQNPL